MLEGHLQPGIKNFSHSKDKDDHIISVSPFKSLSFHPDLSGSPYQLLNDVVRDFLAAKQKNRKTNAIT